MTNDRAESDVGVRAVRMIMNGLAALEDDAVDDPAAVLRELHELKALVRERAELCQQLVQMLEEVLPGRYLTLVSAPAAESVGPNG